MATVSRWLRSGGVLLSVLSLGTLAISCGGAGSADSDAPDPGVVASANDAPAPTADASPAVTAPNAGPTPIQSSSQPAKAIYSDMEIVGATDDEGLNIFYGGWTERCTDLSVNTPDCLKSPVIHYAIAQNRLTAAVDCGANTIGDFVFDDGTYGDGMEAPVGDGMKALVRRACNELRYKEGPVGEVVSTEEPTGEPGYVGYDIIGQTEDGTDVYFIHSQPACEDGSRRPDCDRHEVNLVVGEANTTAVVFCSTGNLNELTIDGVLVRDLMQPRSGAYANVVDRVCSNR